MEHPWLPLLSLLITMKLIIATCPPNDSSVWVQSGSKFFALNTDSPLGSKCGEMDAHLATVDNADEVNAINSLLASNLDVLQLFVPGPKEAKISGLRQLGTTDTYVWVETNATLTDRSWLNLHLFDSTNENCAILNLDTSTIGHPKNCLNEKVEICQSFCRASCSVLQLPFIENASHNGAFNGNESFGGEKIRILQK